MKLTRNLSQPKNERLKKKKEAVHWLRERKKERKRKIKREIEREREIDGVKPVAEGSRVQRCWGKVK